MFKPLSIVLFGVITAILPAHFARGAVEDGAPLRLAEAVPVANGLLGAAADLRLEFFQEDGPDSGLVRVLLTPETRPLTILEARSAAQQAFLDALDEPGLGDNLTRITVVVRLMPKAFLTADPREEVFLFVHKGGREWSVLAGE
ncbi:MAG: hypothetical protein M3453_01260 [Pseudomonadota bacterium]|nr:hypothetical protein [Pseudomonadota bacterium]